MQIPPFPRTELATPALVLDRAALDRNIEKMTRFAAERGLALRPHAKTHKSADIGKRQIAAGAVGLCCAKLAEAEALAGQGLSDIHLTSPVVTEAAIGRLIGLNGRIQALSVVVDNPSNVDRLGQAAAGDGRPLMIFVDIDPGNHRTGVASPGAAVELADRIARSAGLRLGGVQYYCGAEQHIAAYAERRAAIAQRTEYLSNVLAALEAAGHSAPVVTGGGTGSFAIDAELGVLTELQVGSYIFLDRQYLDCEFSGGDVPLFEPSLWVDSTVISANAVSQVTIDAGLKALSAEAGPPLVAAGAGPGSSYQYMGDEHGALYPGDTLLPALGDRIALLPPHCDPTVNLYGNYHVLDGDRIVEIWPVTARGCST